MPLYRLPNTFFKSRCAYDLRGYSVVTQVHLLHGEFLEASQSPAAAKRAFCSSYRAHGAEAADAYARAFMTDGVSALAVEHRSGHMSRDKLARFSLALEYFEMAKCIAPAISELDEAIDEVRRAREDVATAGATSIHQEL
eukprot:scaffold107504_cov33-Tisochrysis_lutea.AAC.2